MININNWEWPQWVVFSVMLFNLLVSPVMHGKPRENYCIYTVIFNTFFSFWLYVSGGFFE